MLELMHQMWRLLLNLLRLGREVRTLAYEWINLMAARQARYFGYPGRSGLGLLSQLVF